MGGVAMCIGLSRISLALNPGYVSCAAIPAMRSVHAIDRPAIAEGGTE
jgi:hypothetical protein